MTKRGTGAKKKQHGRRRVSCETDVTDTTTCSFRSEVSATFSAICEDVNRVVRDESCLLCGGTAFANDRKWTSGSAIVFFYSQVVFLKFVVFSQVCFFQVFFQIHFQFLEFFLDFLFF